MVGGGGNFGGRGWLARWGLPNYEIPRGQNIILGKSVSSTVGETSQKMSENTGETINKYPARRSLVNHTLLQTKTILGKTEMQIWERNKPKLGC